MIDESHNLKDPLEDLIQATDAHPGRRSPRRCASTAPTLAEAQDANDPARAAEVLHRAYRTDVRPLVAEARRRNGAALDPLATYRAVGYRAAKVAERGSDAGRHRPVVIARRRAGRRRRRPRRVVDPGVPRSTSDAARRRRRRPPLRPRARYATAAGICAGTGTGWSPRSSRAGLGARAGPGGVDRRRHVGRRLRPARRRRRRCVAPPHSLPVRPHRRLARRRRPRSASDRLYRTTGIQLQPINTIFQLAAHDRAELARARRLLLLPELLVHHLTGRGLGERTSAGTTGARRPRHRRLVGRAARRRRRRPGAAAADRSRRRRRPARGAASPCTSSAATTPRPRWSAMGRRPAARGVRVERDVAARRRERPAPDARRGGAAGNFTNEPGVARRRPAPEERDRAPGCSSGAAARGATRRSTTCWPRAADGRPASCPVSTPPTTASSHPPTCRPR